MNLGIVEAKWERHLGFTEAGLSGAGLKRAWPEANLEGLLWFRAGCEQIWVSRGKLGQAGLGRGKLGLKLA